jgi:3-ketosteroid 9alpha-monooxygenase subunit A
MRYKGWYNVAFERDLDADLTPAFIGSQSIVLARMPGGVRAFSAICPHRGAHLALGGRLEERAIVCPFHGFRIGIDGPGDHDFRACEFPLLMWGGLIFVRLTESHENGLTALLKDRYRGHYFVPGFEMTARTCAEMVIENGFDAAHFRTVHGITNEPEFTIRHSSEAFIVDGTFEIPTTADYQSRTGERIWRAPYVARAFSGGLVVSDLGGSSSYSVVTAATPTTDGYCIIRLSLILPAPEGEAPPLDLCKHLLQHSRIGLEKDRQIWENLIATPIRFTARDAAVVAFRKFCRDLKDGADKRVKEKSQ